MRKHILTVPNPILRAKSITVNLEKDFDLVKRHIANLEETLEKKANPKGVGLSSPQIGKNLRIFSTYLPDSSNTLDQGRPNEEEKEQAKLATYVNPEIIESSKDTTFGPDPEDPILEGCLSIPSLYGPVPRCSWIMLRYITPQLEEKTQKFSGFYARVIQHELDHLDGVLFIDYVFKYKLPFFEFRKGKMVEIERNIIRALG